MIAECKCFVPKVIPNSHTFLFISLAGPPLTNDTTLVTLMNHDVTVAIGVREAWQAGRTRFDIAWVCFCVMTETDTEAVHICRLD